MPDEEGSKPVIRRRRRQGSDGTVSPLVARRRARATAEQKEIRADLRYYIFNSLTFLPGPAMDLADVDSECPHGRLGGDPSPACGCYPGEGFARNGSALHLGTGTGKAA